MKPTIAIRQKIPPLIHIAWGATYSKISPAIAGPIAYPTGYAKLYNPMYRARASMGARRAVKAIIVGDRIILPNVITAIQIQYHKTDGINAYPAIATPYNAALTMSPRNGC